MRKNAGAHSSVAQIFGKALPIGAAAGIISLFLMGAIYTRLGASGVKKPARHQVIHVLAYAGVPMAASLVIWMFTALLAGEAAFEQTLRPEVEGFVALLLHAQFDAYVLLTIWSVVIQVMGLSEMMGIALRRAFGLWALGQVIGFSGAVCPDGRDRDAVSKRGNQLRRGGSHASRVSLDRSDRQNTKKIRADVRDLGGAYRVRHGILVPFHRKT